MIMKKFFCLVAIAIGLASCTPSVQNPQRMSQLPKIYPDYIGVTIPAGIAPLNFNMRGEAVDVVDVWQEEAKVERYMSVVSGQTLM